jgi:hypothetical protein
MFFSVLQSLEVTYGMLYMFNKFVLFTKYSSHLEDLILQSVHKILQILLCTGVEEFTK